MNNRFNRPQHFGQVGENNDPAPAGFSFVNDQPDMQGQNALRNRMRGHMVSFEKVIEYLDNKNMPPQLRQTPYVAQGVSVNKPTLLIPANPNRMSFIAAIINGLPVDGQAYFSYGYPIKDGSTGNYIGVPIAFAGTGFFQEGNGTVSIDDIYVFWSGSVATTIWLGYEGLLAVESHLHKQTK